MDRRCSGTHKRRIQALLSEKLSVGFGLSASGKLYVTGAAVIYATVLCREKGQDLRRDCLSQFLARGDFTAATRTPFHPPLRRDRSAVRALRDSEDGDRAEADDARGCAGWRDEGRPRRGPGRQRVGGRDPCRGLRRGGECRSEERVPADQGCSDLCWSIHRCVVLHAKV